MIRIRVQDADDLEIVFTTGEKLWIPQPRPDRSLQLRVLGDVGRQIRFMPVAGEMHTGPRLLIEVYTPWT